ncbi:MAG: response regulator [Candidatus Omnitrophica bacterium]|nr:response regulator [Candidatus Omnitrophota bacterium]
MAKLMVIDDESSICSLLCKVFEPEGYEVVTEIDPVKALERFKKEKPDCLLLDIKMPKVDGIEILSAVKEIDASIAVIMITGYGNLENAMESMKLGAYDYITKPFDLDFIKMVVKRSLGNKQ